jgi:hypothetical protein
MLCTAALLTASYSRYAAGPHRYCEGAGFALQFTVRAALSGDRVTRFRAALRSAAIALTCAEMISGCECPDARAVRAQWPEVYQWRQDQAAHLSTSVRDRKVLRSQNERAEHLLTDLIPH